MTDWVLPVGRVLSCSAISRPRTRRSRTTWSQGRPSAAAASSATRSDYFAPMFRVPLFRQSTADKLQTGSSLLAAPREADIASSRQRSAGRLLPLPGPRDGAPGRSQHLPSASAVSRGGRICIFLDKVPSARGDSSCSAEVTCVHISFTCPSRLDWPFFRLRQHKQLVGGCQPATSDKVQVTCQPFGLDRSRFRGHPTAFHDGARRTRRWPPTDADRPSQLTTSR